MAFASTALKTYHREDGLNAHGKFLQLFSHTEYLIVSQPSLFWEPVGD